VKGHARRIYALKRIIHTTGFYASGSRMDTGLQGNTKEDGCNCAKKFAL